MEINKIYKECCMTTLKKMPDNFLDCVITSPPYWQLRDYGYEGQWGLEPNYNEYLEHLWKMMDEIFRVLKNTGTVWINLGDTYSKNKCLLLLPHRFAIGCIDRGWIVRNDIIWAKRNGMPESTTDRFSKKHEYFFFFTKQEKYYFDLDSIRDKHKTIDELNRRIKNGNSEWKTNLAKETYAVSGTGRNRKELYNEKGKNPGDVSDFWDKPQYSILDKNFRNQIVEIRNLPEHEIIRDYLKKARLKSNITIKQIENHFGTQAPHHWFEKNGSYPSKEDWIILKELLNFDNTYDSQMTEIDLKSGLKQNNPNGKNPGDVSDFWDINTKPSSSKHYATYNDELLKKPILSGCPENGIIYDPFMGTGSTAEACLRANRNFIGSEMSEDFIKISENRLKPYLIQTKLF